GPTGQPLTGIQSISTFGMTVLALDAHGTVYAWGMNADGEQGMGDSSTSPFARVASHVPTSATSLSTGMYSSALLRSDGTAWVWGRDNWAQLGDGVKAPNCSSGSRGICSPNAGQEV